MKIAVGQIYVEVGASFPFSHHMQLWLGEQLSSLVEQSPQFGARFGSDYTLTITISARRGLTDNDVKGPTVFKRDKDVEYTVFLPFDRIMSADDARVAAIERILDGVESVLSAAALNATPVTLKRRELAEYLRREPSMLTGAWPSTRRSGMH